MYIETNSPFAKKLLNDDSSTEPFKKVTAKPEFRLVIGVNKTIKNSAGDSVISESSTGTVYEKGEELFIKLDTYVRFYKSNKNQAKKLGLQRQRV